MRAAKLLRVLRLFGMLRVLRVAARLERVLQRLSPAVVLSDAAGITADNPPDAIIATPAQLRALLLVGEAPASGKRGGRGVRLRKKSKDLEMECLQLLAGTLETVFRSFDTDNSGTLEPEELKAAFEAAGRPTSDDKIRQCYKALDTNNDGVISLDEFKQLVWVVSTKDC